MSALACNKAAEFVARSRAASGLLRAGQLTPALRQKETFSPEQSALSGEIRDLVYPFPEQRERSRVKPGMTGGGTTF